MLDEAITVSRNLAVYQNLQGRNLFPTNASDFLSIVSQQPVVMRWVQNANPGSFGRSSLIMSVIGASLPEMTIVRARGLIPSIAGLSERESFAGHVVRQVRAQLHQLAANQPNIIVVQGYNWTIFGLGEAVVDFTPVRVACVQFFNQNRIADLSGICVIGQNFDYMFYINNPNCAAVSHLTRPDVRRLGMRWI